MIKDAITTTEAAEILRLDPSSIRHMIRKQKLACERRGRDNFVSRRAVEKMLEIRKTRENGKKK